MQATRASHTVQLVDDHALIREGLRRALEKTGRFTVVGESASVAEARSNLRARPPDAVVVDLRLPDGNGLDLVREVVPRQPTLAVVVLSMYSGDQELLASREAGASAFVSKDAPASEVAKAVDAALKAPRTFRAEGLSDAERRSASEARPVLTPREIEVLGLLAEGLGVAGISRQLFISESTTKTHVAKIYDKLGASNRVQAVRAAYRLGIIPPDESLGSGIHGQ